jgi:hypothetical protein
MITLTEQEFIDEVSDLLIPLSHAEKCEEDNTDRITIELQKAEFDNYQ